jgi:hypothetical protein
MPIWLRNYTFKSIQEYYEKQQKEQKRVNDEAQGIETAKASSEVKVPDFTKTTYTTKASTK